MNPSISIAILGPNEYQSTISCESADNLYMSTKIVQNRKRSDYKQINFCAYHYGKSDHADRVFDSLHALWIANESSIIEYVNGDNSAYWTIKKALESVDIR